GCPCGDGSSCSSFFQFVAGCPAANGINAAEVTLNVPTEETVDITCNGGANTTISVVGSKSSNLWQVGVNGAYTPLSIQNSWVNGATGVDNNCGGGTGNTGTPIPGVFPFQLSSCTTGPNSCSSATNNVSCSSPNDGEGPCQFTRAAGISGGKVTVSYLGSLQP
ncbi:MAG TPA: hypothetical protein V6C72_11635, partial [Chroococcales cyanobacterium]